MRIFLDNPASSAPPTRRAKTNPGARPLSTAAAPNYYDSADWWQLRAAIMKALQDFPEARDNVVRALRDLHALQEPDASPS
jgi:hypothetical protein